MSTHRSNILELLASLESAFEAFERGQRGKLFDSRDSLVRLSEEVDQGGWSDVSPLCDVIAKLLGRVLREGSLDERSAIAVVRDLLGLVESGVARQPGRRHGDSIDEALGVFKVVNESRLGEMLIKMGKLHPAQVQQALVLQRVSKDKRFGEVLIAMNAIDERTLSEALAAQHVEAKTKGAPSGGSSLKLAPLPDLPASTGYDQRDGGLPPLGDYAESPPPPRPQGGSADYGDAV